MQYSLLLNWKLRELDITALFQDRKQGDTAGLKKFGSIMVLSLPNAQSKTDSAAKVSTSALATSQTLGVCVCVDSESVTDNKNTGGPMLPETCP